MVSGTEAGIGITSIIFFGSPTFMGRSSLLYGFRTIRIKDETLAKLNALRLPGESYNRLVARVLTVAERTR